MYRAMVLAVAACAGQSAPPSTDGALTYLTPTEHLARVSMALRGTRPSIDDLRAVARDPLQLGAIVDRYLDSPEFGATLRDLHNEVLLLRTQRPEFTGRPLGAIADKSFTEISSSLYEEPLRLIEDVVMTNQPYTNIVTADYTVADGIVATIWGMPHSPDNAWERTFWPDGRPAAGILSSSALHLRYRSVFVNYNRGRANAIARGLLCHDFLDGDVKIDTSVDLSDPAVVADAVVHNPNCAGCHQTLDPLASYFFPFAQGNNTILNMPSYPAETYAASSSTAWFGTTNRPPGYFGQEPAGLDGLGRAIAADPRFARCAAINFASYLTEMPHRDLSPRWIAELQDGFTRDHFSAKSLARAIVLSDAFRVSHDADPVAAEGVVGYQKVRPMQLHRMLRALTGFDWSSYSAAQFGPWTLGPVTYLDDDLVGYRVLAGGIDSFSVTQGTNTMNATSSLVVRLAAYRAAQFVVDHDLHAAEHTLLRDVTATDETTVRTELAELHARIFSELVLPTDPAIDPGWELFQGALEDSHDPARAWIVTLTAMLGDLKAVYY